MIVVEGPDASGKTTLAKKLADDFDLDYRRPPDTILSSVTGPAGESLPEWWKEELRFQHDNPEESDGRIYDRCFYISECIYQLAKPDRPLIRDGVDMGRGIHDLWVIEPFMIFCMPPWEAQLGIIQSGRPGLEGVDLATLRKIDWQYWCFYGMWREMVTDCLHYDYTQHEYKWIKEWVGGYVGG